jgi:hypothetical protein
MNKMDYDDLKNKTTKEIKELLDCPAEPIDNVNPLISICMTLCDRIVCLEGQVQKLEKGETEEAKIKNLQPNNGEKTAGLKEQLREAARVAEKQDSSGEFNAMSWLDLELENNPELFDSFFDRAWDELPENEREKRIIAIRRVL